MSQLFKKGTEKLFNLNVINEQNFNNNESTDTMLLNNDKLEFGKTLECIYEHWRI